MKLSRTTIEVYRRGQRFTRPRGMKAGVSLHGHSECSRESLEFVPGLARRLPMIASLFERSVAAYQRQRGKPLDFASIYWRPPATPAEVIASERDQIARRFECEALVALTDHDTFEGPVKLRAIGAPDVPLSVEWTIPVEESVLHLGVHGIPSERLETAKMLFAAYTSGCPRPSLGEILEWLAESHESFVVLNHPYWDLLGVGELRHEALLLAFLREHRGNIHALELNGYRRWSENRRVLPLAEGFALPVIAAGDRHGYAPNSMINLTGARTWEEFASDLRARRPTQCIIFPEYADPFAARILQGARDALGYRSAPNSTWCERVFWVAEDGVERSLASLWPTGGPISLRAAIGVTRLLGSQSLRPLFRLTLSGEHGQL